MAVATKSRKALGGVLFAKKFKVGHHLSAFLGVSSSLLLLLLLLGLLERVKRVDAEAGTVKVVFVLPSFCIEKIIDTKLYHNFVMRFMIFTGCPTFCPALFTSISVISSPVQSIFLHMRIQ